MATKEKKVSVNVFEKLAKEYGGDEYSVITTSGGDEIKVRRYLELNEMISFVNAVADNCFFEDGTQFYPEMRWIYNTLTIFQAYTNLKLPADTKKAYACCVRLSGLIDEIIARVDKVQYNEMQKAITAKIERQNTELAALTAGKMDEVTNAINTVNDKIKEIFGDISGEQVNEIMKSLGDGNLNEKQIIEAVVNKRFAGGDTNGKDRLGEHRGEGEGGA